MSIEETRVRIKSRVWQAIAQARLDISALPDETFDKLVAIVTDAALLELNDEMQQAGAEVAKVGAMSDKSGDGDDTERVLWEGRPFLSLTKHYRITTERVRITEGLLGKDREDIELIKIQDIDQTQRLSERLINIGDITIRSHDPSQPVVMLHNVQDVQRVHEILRRAMLDARESKNFSYREEM